MLSGCAAGQEERARQHPALGLHGRLRPHLTLFRGVDGAEHRAAAGEDGPRRVAQEARSRGLGGHGPRVDERAGIDLGLDGDSPRQLGLLAVGQPGRQTRTRGVHRRSFLPGRARRDPEDGHAPAATHVDERMAIRREHDDADHLLVAAQEEEERALRALPEERRLLGAVSGLVEAGDGGGPSQKGEVRPHRGEPALEGGGAGGDLDVERAPGLVDRPLPRHRDAPEAGEVDGGHGGDRGAGQPAGSAKRLHRTVS